MTKEELFAALKNFTPVCVGEKRYTYIFEYLISCDINNDNQIKKELVLFDAPANKIDLVPFEVVSVAPDADVNRKYEKLDNRGMTYTYANINNILYVMQKHYPIICDKATYDEIKNISVCYNEQGQQLITVNLKCDFTNSSLCCRPEKCQFIQEDGSLMTFAQLSFKQGKAVEAQPEPPIIQMAEEETPPEDAKYGICQNCNTALLPVYDDNQSLSYLICPYCKRRYSLY